MDNQDIYGKTVADNASFLDGGTVGMFDKNRPVPTPRVLYVNVRIDNKVAYQCQFDAEHSAFLRIGRSVDSDLLLSSNIVSREHGVLRYTPSAWEYCDLGSMNGSYVNNNKLSPSPDAKSGTHNWESLSIPSVIKIETDYNGQQRSVELILSAEPVTNTTKIALSKDVPCTIGRDASSTIVLPHVQISRRHAQIKWNGKSYEISDCNSTNGLTVNGAPVHGTRTLKAQDVIRIGRFAMQFMGDYVELHVAQKEGISISINNLSKIVSDYHGLAKKQKTILDAVSLDIHPGELVAIIGGSGAGKSTLMNAISGFTSKNAGTVLVDGYDFDANYATIKTIIGYVPQKDIVFDNLPLQRMLLYASRMRMPQDTSPAERLARIDEVLNIVHLTEHRNTIIAKLSGGQKKRASIAVELLADPTLFFLDEPSSGLDPGTEESLMLSLRDLSNNGKTVILVTHSTLNLHLCDKIIVMGRGGKLCYVGPPAELENYFGVERVGQIYDKLDNEASEWSARCRQQNARSPVSTSRSTMRGRSGVGALAQYKHLTQRYFEIMFRNSRQLLGIGGQAVIFALVLVLVSTQELYDTFSSTQTICFVTACLGMWMGLFLSIQEITKEREILRREYMANLKLIPYILSKVSVLSLIALLQATLMQIFVFVFSHLLDKPLPTTSLLLPPMLENGITLFLVSVASVCMGLAISALVKQPERITPYVLMPQIVFSGVLFKLGGSFDIVSKFVFTYWGNRALCASADVNALGAKHMGILFESVTAYSHEIQTLLLSWLALLGLGAAMLVLATYALRGLSKDERG